MPPVQHQTCLERGGGAEFDQENGVDQPMSRRPELWEMTGISASLQKVYDGRRGAGDESITRNDWEEKST